MNIPLNYTLEETLKYVDMPEELREHLNKVLPDVAAYEEQAEEDERRIDVLEEQLYEARQLVKEILFAVASNFKYKETKELVISIQNLVEDSFLEL